MKGGKSPRGYTIVEVMIVLAVSGVMFVLAASFINGKQARTAFTEGVNQTASRLQDVIEQVTDGKYSDIPLNCSAAGGSVSFPPGGRAQGTNADCVFLGKVLHFSKAGAASDYEVIAVAGSRLDSSGTTPPTTPAAAGARYVPGLTIQTAIPHALDVRKVTITNTTGGTLTTNYGIGILQGLGSLDSSTGSLQNGSQVASLYYVSGLTNNMGQSDAENQVFGNLAQASKADICLTDGTRYANIILGDDNDQLGVTVKMDEGAVACP